MSDQNPDITISGGGDIAVETPVMLTAARDLEALEGTLRQVATQITDLQLMSSWTLLATELRYRADGLANEALVLAASGKRQAVATADALHRAAAAYGTAEHAVDDAVQVAAAKSAATRGETLRHLYDLDPHNPLVLAVAPMVMIDIATVSAAVALTGLVFNERATTGRVDPLNDPAFIDRLRLTISSLDDSLRGFFLLEQPGDLTGNDPSRPFSTASIATSLGAVMTNIAHSDSRVVATEAGDSVPTSPPDALSELIDRLPIAAPNAPQLRIERYDDASGTHWIVYVAGTVTFSPLSGNEPFDMASNLQAVGGVPSASQAGVEAAMRNAGVQPGQPVLLVGHSQGATIVERVAQSGEFSVQGVVTAGGPTGGITLPAAIPVLAVEHTDDLVPALGGVAAGGAAGLNRTLVQRRVYGREVAPDPTVPIDPAHQNPEYSKTLATAEASGSVKVREFRSRIAPFLTGSDGTAAEWRVDRKTGTPAESVPIRSGSGR